MDYVFLPGNNVTSEVLDITVEQRNSYRERIMDKHESVMREILYLYKSLVKENKTVIEEIEQECQEMIKRDMAYAIKFLHEYDSRVDMKRLCATMDDMVFLYGLTYMLERGLMLVRNLVPVKGKIYSEILRGYFFGGSRNTDEKVMESIPGEISRRQYYREKKEAVRVMGYYFFEVVIPQIYRAGGEIPILR